jgi:tRNA-specific 2-thiouridylase
MELCFAGEGDYRLALTSGGPRTGPILDETGRELGRHGGIESFTVGQRRGLGISSRNPLYIVGIDARNNTLVAGPRSQVEKTVVEADRVNILLPEALQDRSRLFGRIRSSAPLQPCTVTMIQEKKLQTVFEKPVFAPAPGQHLVLYSDSGHVVGGGVIK